MLQQRHPDVLLKGSDLFDASLFRDATSTSIFYSFIAELKTSIDNAQPSLTHHFIKTLNAKGRLLRSCVPVVFPGMPASHSFLRYTQNIDGFEERLSLLGSSSEEVQAHILARFPITDETLQARWIVNGRAKIKVKEIRNVQLHGDIHRLRCTVCFSEYPCSAEFLEMLRQGSAPSCRECVIRCQYPFRLAHRAKTVRCAGEH